MFALRSRRFEHASTVLTSSKRVETWGDIFGAEVLAAAVVDRLLSHSNIVNTRRNRGRMRENRALACRLAPVGGGLSDERSHPRPLRAIVAVVDCGIGCFVVPPPARSPQTATVNGTSLAIGGLASFGNRWRGCQRVGVLGDALRTSIRSDTSGEERDVSCGRETFSPTT